MGADQLLSNSERLRQIIDLWHTDISIFTAIIYMESSSIQFLFYHLTIKSAIFCKEEKHVYNNAGAEYYLQVMQWALGHWTARQKIHQNGGN